MASAPIDRIDRRDPAGYRAAGLRYDRDLATDGASTERQEADMADDITHGDEMNGQKQDQDRDSQQTPAQAPDTGNDTEESGAGYGNHGDVQHSATGGSTGS